MEVPPRGDDPPARPTRVAVLRLPIRAFGFGCILVGLSVVSNIVANLRFDERSQHTFVETTCRMSTVERVDDLRRPFNQVVYDYTVDGLNHRSAAYSRNTYFPDSMHPDEIPISFHAGAEYKCWYDPGAPETVVLTRDVRLKWESLEPQGIGALLLFASGFLFLAELIQFRIPARIGHR